MVSSLKAFFFAQDCMCNIFWPPLFRAVQLISQLTHFISLAKSISEKSEENRCVVGSRFFLEGLSSVVTVLRLEPARESPGLGAVPV